MMQVRVAEITETAKELDARLEHKEYYAEKIAGLKPESRRLREILAVRCLLKEMTREEQEVFYNEESVPAIKNGYVSISHTDGYAAVILSDVGPVGIDIERRGKKVEKVVSRFMQDSEVLLAENSLAKHLIWSAKEAAFKVLGKEYFDLQNLTRVTEIDFENETMTMEVVGRERPLTIHFKYIEEYVLCYLILD